MRNRPVVITLAALWAAAIAAILIAVWPADRDRRSPPPHWVVLDFASGIKTTELADGSLHEEPIDPAEATRVAARSAAPPAVGPDEPLTTGSVASRR